MTRTSMTCRSLVAFALATFCIVSAAPAQSVDNAWLDQPEASFMTNAERQEWWALHSEAEREAFRGRYWARRDPTPGTPQNEFRDVVMQRIATADKKYTLDRRLRGALTSRGQVYIVLGAPARINVDQSGYNAAPAPPPGPYAVIPRRPEFAEEGNEIKEIWYYERTRTPKILEALNRPSLDLTFVVEPVKQIDDLQNPGLFHQLRETIAEKTVMNNIPAVAGGVVPSVAPSPSPALSVPAAKIEMTTEIESALDRAGDSGSAVRSSVLWNGDAPQTTFWLVAPDAAQARGPLALYGRVKDSSGKIVATVARAFETSKTFGLQQSGAVADATVALPPGEYDAAFILNDSSNNSAVAAGTGHVVVPQAASDFAVSSLILTDRISGSGDGMTLGRARVRPRADATFTTAESMWYLFQVANPSDPAKVTVAIRLRHGTAPPTSPTVVPAALESIGPGRYISGFEMPLAGFAPGDYTLYVSVHDPAGRDDVVRRADFRVVEAPRVQ